MEKIRQKLIQVMSRTLSIEEFEAFLYEDSFVKESILEDEAVFELASMNFKLKEIHYELKKYCFKHFDKEELLIDLIRSHCEKYDDNPSKENCRLLLESMCALFDFEDNYFLIEQYYWLESEFEDYIQGYGDQKRLFADLRQLINRTLDAFSTGSLEQKKEILKSGFDFGEGLIINHVIMSPKKWFQFWK